MGQSRLGTVPVKNSVSFASIRVIRGLNHPLQRFFKTGLPSSMYMNRMTFAQALPMASQEQEGTRTEASLQTRWSLIGRLKDSEGQNPVSSER